ncbi:MAG TPA: hypothetical protein VHT27_00570 [Solirubrobacteraceae bacterium]|nr:hypothetical protein [Solirubrobacteraceae bacterium]
MTPPAAAARAVAPGAPFRAPRRSGRAGPETRPRPPRRISGPARPSERPRTAARRGEGLVPALHRLYERLADHPLIDRLIRGRAWIGLVAFALIGIVTLQLGLLELNTRIGRELEREGRLQRENAALSIQNSEMASGEGVEAVAHKLGMQLVPTGALRFLSSHPAGDVPRAASALNSAAPAAHASAASTEASTTPSSTGGEASHEGGATSAGESGSGASSTESSSSTHEPAATAEPSHEAASSGSSEAPAEAPHEEATTSAAGGTGAAGGG